jgi:biopolymer transport protein ExbD
VGAAAPNVGQIVLDIDAAGNVFANGQAQSANPMEHQLPPLEAFLKSVTSANAEIAVQIRPTNETRQERVIDVLNSCRQAKVKNIAFR